MSLKDETIKAFSRDASFRRGEKYYYDGRVVDLRKDGQLHMATIIGTERYSCSFDISNLGVSCNCYAYDGDDWCKHIVALALTIAHGEVAKTEQPKVKKVGAYGYRDKYLGIENNLDSQPKELLVTAIKIAADKYPDVWEIVDQLVNPPVLDNPKVILKAVKSAFLPVRRAQNWHRQEEAAVEASQTMCYVAQTALENETSLRGLLISAVWAYSQLNNIDDSNGELQDGIDCLTQRAVQIANVQHKLLDLLYEPLAEKTDLPLIEMIFAEGDDIVREDCLQRLDTHLNRRNQQFVAISQETAKYYMLDYLSNRGDKRVIDLINDYKINDSIRINTLVKYYESCKNWTAVIKELWPIRNKHREFYHSSLWNALQKAGDINKIVQYQKERILTLSNPVRELLKLEYLLRQHQRIKEYDEVVTQVIEGKYISIEAKLELFYILKRYGELADLACRFASKTYGQPGYINWSGRPKSDIAVSFAIKLTNVSPQHSIQIWRSLFNTEKTIVTQSSTNYKLFELICENLTKLNDTSWLLPKLDQIIIDFPTRQKLVLICKSYS